MGAIIGSTYVIKIKFLLGRTTVTGPNTITANSYRREKSVGEKFAEGSLLKALESGEFVASNGNDKQPAFKVANDIGFAASAAA